MDNEFGAAAGWPIKKDKLFFFVSYEGGLHRELATQFGTVPMAAIKAGNMSGSTLAIYVRILAILSVAPTALRSWEMSCPPPASALSPQSSADLTPLPNLPDLLSNNYYAARSYLFDRNRGDSKVNWNINQKWTAFARFSVNHDQTVPTLKCSDRWRAGDLNGRLKCRQWRRRHLQFHRRYNLHLYPSFRGGRQYRLDAHGYKRRAVRPGSKARARSGDPRRQRRAAL